MWEQMKIIVKRDNNEENCYMWHQMKITAIIMIFNSLATTVDFRGIIIN